MKKRKYTLRVAYFTRTSTLNAVSPWFFLNFYCLPNHLAFFTLVLNRKTSYWSGNSWTTVKAKRSEDYKVLPKLVYDTVTKKKFSFQKRSFPFPYRGVVQLETKPVNVRLRDSIGNRNRDLQHVALSYRLFPYVYTISLSWVCGPLNSKQSKSQQIFLVVVFLAQNKHVMG